MVGHGGSSAGLYLANPTCPIAFHCASIVATSTFKSYTYVCHLLPSFGVHSCTFYDCSIASAGSDGLVVVWGILNGDVQQVLDVHQHRPISCLAVMQHTTPDGMEYTALLTAASDRHIIVSFIPLSHYSRIAPRIHNVGHIFQIAKVPSGVCKVRPAFLLDSATFLAIANARGNVQGRSSVSGRYFIFSKIREFIKNPIQQTYERTNTIR